MDDDTQQQTEAALAGANALLRRLAENVLRATAPRTRRARRPRRRPPGDDRQLTLELPEHRVNTLPRPTKVDPGASWGVRGHGQ
jgi:hypothetical protein